MNERSETDAEFVPEDKETNDQKAERNRVLLRGLFMLVFTLLYGIAEFILGILTLLQFFWLLFTKQPNEPIKSFGTRLSNWVRDVARFQVAETEEKPFPWKEF